MNAPTLPARLDRSQRRILCGYPVGQPRCSGYFGRALSAATASGLTDERDLRTCTLLRTLFYVGDERTAWGLWLDPTFVRAPDGVFRMGQHARRRYHIGQRPRNRRELDFRAFLSKQSAFLSKQKQGAPQLPVTGGYPWRDEWRHGFRAECPRCRRINVLHPALLFAETVFDCERLPDGAVRWRVVIFDIDDVSRIC